MSSPGFDAVSGSVRNASLNSVNAVLSISACLSTMVWAPANAVDVAWVTASMSSLRDATKPSRSKPGNFSLSRTPAMSGRAAFASCDEVEVLFSLILYSFTFLERRCRVGPRMAEPKKAATHGGARRLDATRDAIVRSYQKVRRGSAVERRPATADRL